ncbi:MAG: hypothetical protein KGL15_03960 [Acidobacteriota bacterium]|nr:hypothetical protein [Acidobacteriota bacterium]
MPVLGAAGALVAIAGWAGLPPTGTILGGLTLAAVLGVAGGLVLAVGVGAAAVVVLRGRRGRRCDAAGKEMTL